MPLRSSARRCSSAALADLKAQFLGDLGAGGRKARALHEVLNQGKDLSLAGGQGAHAVSPRNQSPRIAA